MNEELETALDALAQAHGSKALAEAFERAQRSVRRDRRKHKIEYGPLATAVGQAIEIRDQMKASGMTGDDLNRGLEGVLRDLWPKPHGRTTPWRFNCETCSDYGYEWFECPGDVSCGRTNPHSAHSYVRPCFCAKGRTMIEKAIPTPDDTMQKASKSKKMTRWGR